MPFDELMKLAMHLTRDEHDSAVTVSCDRSPKLTGDDHVAPPSSVVRNRGPLLAVSRIAHVMAA
jgi:hypothetical protein